MMFIKMSQNQQQAIANNTYKATSIHSSFKFNIDYWLIGKGQGFVDAKRINPIIALPFYILMAYFCLNTANEIETFRYLFTTEESESRVDWVLSTLAYYWDIRAYYKFTNGIFLTIVLFLLGIHLLFAPYPCPVRFNQKNGLVYTKYRGRVWITNWHTADIKLWRNNNDYVPLLTPYKGIQIRLYALDKKGHWMQRWVILSAVNSHKIDALKIGGDPCLLYWNWLNQYMQGASFAEDAAQGVKKIPEPIVGRLLLLEAIMRFRGYKFQKKIDEKAIELDQFFRDNNVYHDDEADKLPKNPFFTWRYDHPNKPMPDAKGNFKS